MTEGFGGWSPCRQGAACTQWAEKMRLSFLWKELTGGVNLGCPKLWREEDRLLDGVNEGSRAVAVSLWLVWTVPGVPGLSALSQRSGLGLTVRPGEPAGQTCRCQWPGCDS